MSVIRCKFYGGKMLKKKLEFFFELFCLKFFLEFFFTYFFFL